MESKKRAMSKQQTKDLGLGCLGCLLVNGIMAAAVLGTIWVVSGFDLNAPWPISNTVTMLAFCGLPLLLNVIGFVVLAVMRPWMALGAAFALVVASLVMVVLGGASFWFLFVRGY